MAASSDESAKDAAFAVESQVAPGAAHDKALALLSESHIAFDLNSPEAIAVKRKIDLHILPCLVLTVLLQNMDKATLSYAAIMGLKTDLKLTPSEYSWAGSLIYFGFLIFEIPCHALLQRVPSISRYSAVTVVIWGTIVCCHAACKNFAGLAVCRLLLGVAECSVTPAFVVLTANFYTPQEQIVRVAWWFGTAAFAQIFGGIIAYGIYHAPSFQWEALFLLFGLLTIIHGIFLWFKLADSPAHCNFLTDEEKVIALERVRVGKTGSETWAFDKDQLFEALKDPRVYLFFLMMVCSGLPNGGVGAFGPTIISGFGFSVANTTLLGMAPGLSEFIGIVIAVNVARITGSRAWTGFSMIMVAVVGIIMMLAIPPAHVYARFAGYCLLYWWPIVVIFVISFLSSCVSGTTKKLVFNCAYNLGYSIGNILGPQTFRGSDAPNYFVAKSVMLAFIVVSGFITLAIWGVHKTWNRQRDRQDAEDLANGIVHEKMENEEFLDRTDRQQRAFRYPL